MTYLFTIIFCLSNKMYISREHEFCQFCSLWCWINRIMSLFQVLSRHLLKELINMVLLDLSHLFNFKYSYICILYAYNIPVSSFRWWTTQSNRKCLSDFFVHFLGNLFFSDWYRINDNPLIMNLAKCFKKVQINLKGHINLRKSKHCFK